MSESKRNCNHCETGVKEWGWGALVCVCVCGGTGVCVCVCLKRVCVHVNDANQMSCKQIRALLPGFFHLSDRFCFCSLELQTRTAAFPHFSHQQSSVCSDNLSRINRRSARVCSREPDALLPQRWTCCIDPTRYSAGNTFLHQRVGPRLICRWKIWCVCM